MPVSPAAYVPFPTTIAPVSLRGNDNQYSIMGFFGPLVTGPYGRAEDPRLLEYLKGGAFVPNVAQNAAVPSAAPIDMTDLLGAYAALQITDLPNKSVVRDPVPQVANSWYYCQWSFQLKNGVDCTDHTYKHGEFKWVETGVSFSDPASIGTDVSNASDTTYSASHKGHIIQIGVYTGSDGMFETAVTRTSTLTCYLRSAIDNSITTSVSCSTSLSIIPNSTL